MLRSNRRESRVPFPHVQRMDRKETVRPSPDKKKDGVARATAALPLVAFPAKRRMVQLMTVRIVCVHHENQDVRCSSLLKSCNRGLGEDAVEEEDD